MTDADVTDRVRVGNPDDELLPVLRCVCGATHSAWAAPISIYADDPTVMPCCGRRLYFRQAVRVMEVKRHV